MLIIKHLTLHVPSQAVIQSRNNGKKWPNPQQTAIKFFSTAEVMEMAKDRAWLAKMTHTISQHWHKRHVRQ